MIFRETMRWFFSEKETKKATFLPLTILAGFD